MDETLRIQTQQKIAACPHRRIAARPPPAVDAAYFSRDVLPCRSVFGVDALLDTPKILGSQRAATEFNTDIAVGF